MCFLIVFKKSFFTKIYVLIAAINLTTRGPLYTCLVANIVSFVLGTYLPKWLLDPLLDVLLALRFLFSWLEKEY